MKWAIQWGDWGDLRPVEARQRFRRGQPTPRAWRGPSGPQGRFQALVAPAPCVLFRIEVGEDAV